MNERQKQQKKATWKRYYQKNKATILVKGNAWRRNNPDKVLNTKLKARYGISLETRRIIEKYQQGKCKICGEKGNLYVDHSHQTGLVRALLCGNCNLGLGSFKDKPELLLKAAEYLKIHVMWD